MYWSYEVSKIFSLIIILYYANAMASVITGVPAPNPFLETPGEPTIPWSNWIKTFENYLLAVDIDETTEEKRCRALLIACLGTEGQRILYTFDQTKLKSISDYKNALKKYFQPESSKWSERVKFSERRQGKNESVKSFVADLRQIASKCDFQTTKDCLMKLY